MTIDDLVKVFRSKAWPIPMKDGGEGSDREGVTAIVRALRDETRHMTLNRDSLEELFTQILGDAGEKVAGGSAREDEQAAQPGSTTPATPKDEEHFGVTVGREFPATDAAPAVCVWTETSIDPLGYAWLNSSCGLVDCHERDVLMQPDPQKHCPSCGKPIKFTEAK